MTLHFVAHKIETDVKVATQTLWRPEPPSTSNLTNSDDPDRMPHNAAFYEGLHILLKENQCSEIRENAFSGKFSNGPS